MADERENIRPPEKSLTPGAKPDAKVVAPIPPQKDVAIGLGTVTPEMERYRAMIAKDPSSRVFAALAELYRKAGMLDEAVRLCLNGTKAHPKYMSGRVALARAYFDKGMIKEAKEEVLTVVSITPDNILANKILGDIQLSEGDTAQAEESIMKVLALSPDDAEAKEKLIEAQRGPKRSPDSQGVKEEILEGEILEGEILEEVADGETSEILEDVVPIEDGDKIIIDQGGQSPPRESAPIDESGRNMESESLDIPLDDDGSLDDLLVDEFSQDSPKGARTRETGADAGDGQSGEAGELLEGERGEGQSETAVGYAPDERADAQSDRQTQGVDIDIEGDQDLVDEFGILEGSGGDITVEGLDNGRKSAEPAPIVPREEKPATGGRGQTERGRSTLIAEAPGEEEDETSDTQGITITTETIADIYVKQGYFERALAVYEDLLGIYPARDSLKQKIAFVKNKIRTMAGEGQDQAMISPDERDKTAAVDVPEAADSRKLQKNVESLNRWLLSIRKLRRF